MRAVMNHAIIIYAVDIGSEKGGNLAWCRLHASTGQVDGKGESLTTLAASLLSDLKADTKVAIGFECPLVLDLRANPKNLTDARSGEGNRPWSAGAGGAVLAVGAVQTAWLFRELADARAAASATFDWAEFVSGRANLLIWEAFVSNKPAGHSYTHHDDAFAAASAFRRAITSEDGPSSVLTIEAPYSMAAAALLRAGRSSDVSLLSKPCLVLRAQPGDYYTG